MHVFICKTMVNIKSSGSQGGRSSEERFGLGKISSYTAMEYTRRGGATQSRSLSGFELVRNQPSLLTDLCWLKSPSFTFWSSHLTVKAAPNSVITRHLDRFVNM